MADRNRRTVDHRRNIKNDETPLFKSLTKLFSGPLVNFRQQAQQRFRRRDLNKFKFTSASGKQFQKTSYNPFDSIQANILANQTRAERYSDFDQMEFTGEINSALDIYADEMTTHSSISKMLAVKSPNQEIRGILETLYYDVLNVEFNLFGWCRTMVKFGDMFLYLDIDPEMGVKSVLGLPTPEIERLEGLDKSNPAYVQYQWNSGGLTFENWQIAHFRVLGQDKYAPYGTSVLEGARRIWRQLCVAKGEKVLTPNGPLNIEDVKAGDRVYCWDPETGISKITKVIATKHMGKQDVYEIRTNHRKVKVTDKHGLLVFDGKEYLYKQAKEININSDKLVLPTTEENKSTHKIQLPEHDYYVSLKDHAIYSSAGVMEKIKNCDCEYSDKNIHAFLAGKKRIPYGDYVKLKKEFDIADDLVCLWPKNSDKLALVNQDLVFECDKELAKLFGFLLGDGWIGHNRVGFATGVDETLNCLYKNLLEKYSKSISNTIEWQKGISGGQVNVFSVEFAEILEKLDFHTGALNKKCPPWIFGMSKEIRREFIQGYFDADGGKNDGRVTSISLELLEGIQELAYSCGIPAGQIIEDRPERVDESGIHRYASHRMYLNMNRDSWGDTYKLEKVLSYSLSRENEDTYDIQVEDDLHNFIVSGIVSHNTLLEDAMMAYRIVRAPDRRVFKIDVGNINPDDVEQFMLRIQNQMKRNMIVDPNTGRVDLRYNPMSIDEDYYIPVRGDSKTTIDTLQGGNFVGDIEDVEYLRDKLFSAIKIPASYLSRAKGGDEDKATLAQKDIRFARTIQRLQRAVVSELEKIGMIHLFTLGYRNEDLLNFSLALNNPSKISELQELEHWKTKFAVAAAATEGFFSKQWIAEKIFNLSEQDYKKIQREMYFDKQFEASLEASATTGMAPQGDAGDALGDISSDMGGLGPELPETGGEAGGGEAPEAPSSEVTEPVIPGAGGAPAKRRDDLKELGKKQSNKGSMASKLAQTNHAAINPGATDIGRKRNAGGIGLYGVGQIKDIVSLNESTYKDKNERQLHEINSDLKNLLIYLEQKNAK